MPARWLGGPSGGPARTAVSSIATRSNDRMARAWKRIIRRACSPPSRSASRAAAGRERERGSARAARSRCPGRYGDSGRNERRSYGAVASSRSRPEIDRIPRHARNARRGYGWRARSSQSGSSTSFPAPSRQGRDHLVGGARSGARVERLVYDRLVLDERPGRDARERGDRGRFLPRRPSRPASRRSPAAKRSTLVRAARVRDQGRSGSRRAGRDRAARPEDAHAPPREGLVGSGRSARFRERSLLRRDPRGHRLALCRASTISRPIT